jgi:hypothetical protein
MLSIPKNLLLFNIISVYLLLYCNILPSFAENLQSVDNARIKKISFVEETLSGISALTFNKNISFEEKTKRGTNIFMNTFNKAILEKSCIGPYYNKLTPSELTEYRRVLVKAVHSYIEDKVKMIMQSEKVNNMKINPRIKKLNDEDDLVFSIVQLPFITIDLTFVVRQIDKKYYIIDLLTENLSSFDLVCSCFKTALKSEDRVNLFTKLEKEIDGWYIGKKYTHK